MPKPQRGLVAAFLAVLVAALTCLPAAAQDVANPPWPSSCPLKLGLLVDRSTSMGARFGDVREATRNVVDALRDKRSEVTIIGFGTVASALGSPVDVSDEDARHDLKDRIDDLDTGGDVGGATNWEAALTTARPLDLDVVVLITDGEPNAFGNPPQESTEQALTAAKAVSDQLKTSGTRVVGVGIDLATTGEENLKAVTGPVAGQDHFVSDTSGLLRQLYDIVASSCGVPLTALPTPEPAVFPWQEVLLGALGLLLLVGLIALLRHRGRGRVAPVATAPKSAPPAKPAPVAINHQDLMQEMQEQQQQRVTKQEQPKRSMSLDFLADKTDPTTKDNP